MYKLIPSALLLVLVLSVCVSAPIDEQQFTHLANGFLHGQLGLVGDLTKSPSDLVYFRGQTYWALGPLPALMLMPLVVMANLLGFFFNQAYLQWLLVLVVFWLVYKLATVLNYKRYDSLVLAFGFVLGSAFIGVAASGRSWYFAQVVSVALSFWALLEYSRQKRWWLLGVICGLLVMTRLSAGLLILFYIWENLAEPKSRRRRAKKLWPLVAPFIAAVLVLAAYNFARFGSVLDQGYAHQRVPAFYAQARDIGLFSPAHIATNFYYMFLNGPVAFHSNGSYSLSWPYFGNNPWGMSLFVTSPYHFYLFTIRRRDLTPKLKRLLVIGGLIMLVVLCWFATGWRQFGYRLALDFLPIFFLVFMVVYRQRHQQLSRRMRLLLLGAGFINFYLMLPYVGLVGGR